MPQTVSDYKLVMLQLRCRAIYYHSKRQAIFKRIFNLNVRLYKMNSISYHDVCSGFDQNETISCVRQFHYRSFMHRWRCRARITVIYLWLVIDGIGTLRHMAVGLSEWRSGKIGACHHHLRGSDHIFSNLRNLVHFIQKFGDDALFIICLFR
jgi:hypothetical protein